MRKKPVYILLLTLLSGLGLMLSSLWWSHIPVRGFLQHVQEPVPFEAVYYGLRSPFDSRMREPLPATADGLIIAPQHLLNGRRGAAPTLFPLYDGTVAPEVFTSLYPGLPAEALPGYDKTVYAVEYADVRLLMLNSSRLTDPAQLSWARNVSLGEGKPVNLLFLDHLPPEVRQDMSLLWKPLAESAIDAIVAGSEVYVRATALEQPPAEWAELAADGWKHWAPAVAYPAAEQLRLVGQGSRLRIQALSGSGEALDQVALDGAMAERKARAQRPAMAVVPPQSLWSYRPGGEDIRSFVPEGFDVTGEHPTVGRTRVPSEDWRSPAFDDTGWTVGEAPLGLHRDPLLQRFVKTPLPLQIESPTYYFRKSFQLEGTMQEVERMTLLISYEDGFAAYLNGEEIARNGVATGLLTPQKLAEPNEAVLQQAFDLTGQKDKLKPGRNVLAVEVHRSHPSAPNLLFDASLTVERRGGAER